MASRLSHLSLLLAVFLALGAIACDDDDDAPAATATSAAATSEPAETPSPQPSQTPPPAAVDPCTLRESLEGGALVPGPSFMLDVSNTWQLCIGGAAAGSSEKYLFQTADGGANWTLISMTTLGNPPPEPGAGELPNGNAAEALFFIDESTGWLGLSSPGENLFRSQDGGVSWTFIDALPAGLPVTAIDFTDAANGTLTTPEGEWTTTDGGETWTETS